MRDPYKTLKVPRSATPEEITKAYRALAFKYHPDRNPGDKRAEQRFKDVQEAYDLLLDAVRRKRFDETGETDVKIDRELAQMLAIVSCIFANCMAEVIAQGHDPARYDVLVPMRQVVAEGYDRMSREQLSVLALKERWERVVGRFAVDEGQNYMEAMATKKLAELESQLLDLGRQIEQNRNIMAMLKKYSFTLEKTCMLPSSYGFVWSTMTG